MKEFMFIFRNEPANIAQATSPEAAEASMKLWMDWIGNIAAQNKLVSRGNRLAAPGKVMRPGHIVTDGPYTEIKEVVGGYTVVRAASLEEATAMAEGCPILARGGSVEVREIDQM